MLRATLLPSPTKTSVLPFSPPNVSRIVSRSPSAWQGCDRSDSPLITGTREFAANSATVACVNVRSTTPST